MSGFDEGLALSAALKSHLSRGPAIGTIRQAGRCMLWETGMRSSRAVAQGRWRHLMSWPDGTGSLLRLLQRIKTAVEFALCGISQTLKYISNSSQTRAVLPCKFRSDHICRRSPVGVVNAKVAERVAMVLFGPDVMFTTGSEHSAAVLPSQAGLPALVRMPW